MSHEQNEKNTRWCHDTAYLVFSFRDDIQPGYRILQASGCSDMHDGQVRRAVLASTVKTLCSAVGFPTFVPEVCFQHLVHSIHDHSHECNPLNHYQHCCTFVINRW
jgi:hypothetical protein